MKKKKLLVVIQFLRRGGVELAALNFLKNADSEKYDKTVLLVDPNEHQDKTLVSEVLADGIKIERIPENIHGYLGRYGYIKSFIGKNRFDIIHSHVMFFSGIVMLAAKKNSVSVRVAHSHIVKWNRKENIPYKIYKHIMRRLINVNATDLLACSNAAGIFLYGKKAFEKKGTFIANGINIDNCLYNENAAKSKRNEFKISEDTLLVGHIGTIYRIKNQTFLVEIFAEILKKNPDSILLLVGEEVDTAPVKQRAEALGISESVIFAGQRNDVSQLLSAMDIMIFPSLHEALPLTLIEAQASGLPCLISDTVTNEVKFNENVEFMPLSSAPAEWADKAFELLKIKRTEISTQKLRAVYDIACVEKQLDKIYLKNN